MYNNYATVAPINYMYMYTCTVHVHMYSTTTIAPMYMYMYTYMYMYFHSCNTCHSLYMYMYLSQSVKHCFESFAKVPVGKRAEYPCHCGVIECLYRYHVEVTSKPTSDVVTPAPWWAHCRHYELRGRDNDNRDAQLCTCVHQLYCIP